MANSISSILTPRSLTIQSVLYRNAPKNLERFLDSLARAIKLAFRAGILSRTEIQFGDCSPYPVFTEEQLREFNARYFASDVAQIGCECFNINCGWAAGHNRLLSNLVSDLVLMLDPSVIVAPNLLIELLQPLTDPVVGVVEARQIPIEHPKEYDSANGDTSWASTVCALIRRSVMIELGGFDHSNFCLYFSDIDLSWRARLAGYRVVSRPAAVVFYDKRLPSAAKWVSTSSEDFYSAEGALLLAHKYSRPDLVEKIINDFTSRGSAEQKLAIDLFHMRQKEGSLPTPIDSENRVAQFINGAYAQHRF